MLVEEYLFFVRSIRVVLQVDECRKKEAAAAKTKGGKAAIGELNEQEARQAVQKAKEKEEQEAGRKRAAALQLSCKWPSIERSKQRGTRRRRGRRWRTGRQAAA